MDFTKFVSLLSTKSLYFPSAESFEDPFEGAKGVRKRKEHWDGFYLDFFRRAVRSIPGRGAQLSEIDVEKEGTDLLRQMERSGQLDRRTTFISCWHENTHESEAMWRLYSSYIDNAIAVRTSYQRLYEALGRDVRIRIGRVEYLDLDADFAGPNDAFWRKRKSFDHEREVRAVISEPESQKSGILVSCDVDRLIAGVVLSPKSPIWFVKLVKDVTSKYGLALDVTPSSLNEEPFF